MRAKSLTSIRAIVARCLWVLSPVCLPIPTTAVPAEIDRVGKDCLSVGCHAELNVDAVVHGPVVQGKCTPCHEQPDPQIHAFKEVPTTQALCESCHVLAMRTFVHKPVQEGQCLDCHDPHQSAFRFMLKADPTKDLCLTCHQDEGSFSRAYVHGPVAAGACILCHEPHAAWNDHLLITAGRDLCLTCHDQVKRRLATAHVLHAPAQDDCTVCHDPHGSARPLFLRQKKRDLCLSCHDDIRERMADTEHVHGALDSEEGCTTCHDGHASLQPKLLRRPLMDSCLSCHDRSLTTPDGRSVPDMASFLQANPDHHGPIRRADCSACHEPHASPNFDLLKETYPKLFYAPFDPNNYRLCFQCHVQELVTVKEGRGLTGFRDGSLNLHYVHVNKTRKGRTCRACHEVHASTYPFHICTSVPFGRGGWSYPITFEKTPTGGRCAAGCHRPKEYNRSGGKPTLPPVPRRSAGGTGPAMRPVTLSTGVP